MVIPLFVYGTLKRGFPNHHYLQNSIFLGEAETLEKFIMYIKDNIPFVSESIPKSTIKGELYLITEDVLLLIDRLEENGFWYNRKLVMVKLTNKEKLMEAWLYFNEFEKGKIEESGEYRIDVLFSKF